MEQRSGAGGATLKLTIVICAIALIAAIAWTGRHVAALRYQADRFVTVKGLAERELPADLIIWPINYTVTADTLDALYQRLEEARATILAFMTGAGFDNNEINIGQPRITDNAAVYRMGDAPASRFVAEAAVTVRSRKVEKARAKMQESGELVKKGIVLSNNYSNAEYVFTALNNVKPAMIAEATMNARKAAEQFAKDSGSRIGEIKQATQGYFSIEDRDAFTPEIKRIRIVTTVEYFLR